MMKGLVLEGGAMRGLFTAGVMDVMLEHDIRFDGIVGVSAGAAFGCNYKSEQPGRVIRYNLQYTDDWRFASMRSLLVTGDYFGAEFAYHQMPNELDVFNREVYDANPTKFYAVCTDVINGKAVYKHLPKATDEAFEWIRASASMPLCSRIVKIGDNSLLDGGITDSIPLKWMESQGYRRNVVVLTQPAGYTKTPNRLMPLIRLKYHRYPNLVYAMQHRHEMYNAQIEYVTRAEREGRALVIRPPMALPIGHICHDAQTMQLVYDIGRITGEKYLDDIVKYLNTQSR